MDYDYLRVEVQRVLEESGLDRLQAVIKIEKLISELQREDRLKAQMEKDLKLSDSHAEVFSKIFGRLNY